MYVETVESNEVISIVNKIKSKTSSDHDNISTKLTKQSINNIIKPLTNITNNCNFPQSTKNKTLIIAQLAYYLHFPKSMKMLYLLE